MSIPGIYHFSHVAKMVSCTGATRREHRSHCFFNFIYIELTEIIPHNVSQRVLVCARLPFLADPGVYDDGEAAVFVWMYFFLHGSVHIEKVYSDVFCQQCIINRILLYYNLTNKQD